MITIKISQESSDSRLVRPKYFFTTLLPLEEVMRMVEISEGRDRR